MDFTRRQWFSYSPFMLILVIGIFILSVLGCLISSTLVFVRMCQRDDRLLIAKTFIFFLVCPLAFWAIGGTFGLTTVASFAIAFSLLYLRGWMDRLGKVMWTWTACIGVAIVSGLVLIST